MKRVNVVNEQRFKLNGENHRIDQGGNHFINGICVNPVKGEYAVEEDGVYRQRKVGSTYPIGQNVTSELVVLYTCTADESLAVQASEQAKADKRKK